MNITDTDVRCHKCGEYTVEILKLPSGYSVYCPGCEFEKFPFKKKVDVLPWYQRFVKRERYAQDILDYHQKEERV